MTRSATRWAVMVFFGGKFIGFWSSTRVLPVHSMFGLEPSNGRTALLNGERGPKQKLFFKCGEMNGDDGKCAGRSTICMLL